MMKYFYQHNKNSISTTRKNVTIKELFDNGIITDKETANTNGKQFTSLINFNNITKFEYKANIGGG